MRTLLLGCALSLAVGCGGSSATQEPADAEPAETTGGEESEPATSGRPTLTSDECTAQGGTLVGDIGDGATQSPDYRCANGQPPIGSVALGIEGSVCCGP